MLLLFHSGRCPSRPRCASSPARHASERSSVECLRSDGARHTLRPLVHTQLGSILELGLDSGTGTRRVCDSIVYTSCIGIIKFVYRSHRETLVSRGLVSPWPCKCVVCEMSPAPVYPGICLSSFSITLSRAGIAPETLGTGVGSGLLYRKPESEWYVGCLWMRTSGGNRILLGPARAMSESGVAGRYTTLVPRW